MSVLTRIANVAHKATTTALFGAFGFGLYVVGSQVQEGLNGGAGNAANTGTAGNAGKKVEEEVPQESGFINMLRTKAEEEYKNYYKIDHREWYDKDGEYRCMPAGTIPDARVCVWSMVPVAVIYYLFSVFCHACSIFHFPLPILIHFQEFSPLDLHFANTISFIIHE